jgi:hypothetical protein
MAEESKSKDTLRNIFLILFIIIVNGLIAGILIHSFFFSN